MSVLVPTMGALHKGHQALIKRARTLDKEVIVSIFVNPLQFENKEDVDAYPRTPERDIEIATIAGATQVWFPEFEELYPEGFQTITADPLGSIFEGASRPGHFDGVVTVVNRLFALTKPSKAIFGEKDFQQLSIIKAMKTAVEIIGVPTVREFDGLAMSSRNLRLSDSGRNVALVIHRSLAAAKLAPTVEIAQEILNTTLSTEPGFDKDYATIIDEKDFSLAQESTENRRAIIAGWVEGVRLIDNMPMVGREQCC
jgi:pantoate--beta-alanine ligase